MSERLDKELVNRGLVESREKGKKAISEERVSVDGVIVTSPKYLVNEENVITITQSDEYVSRAAGKLKGALSSFGVSLVGKECLDIGASTGGFTQVCLESGAKSVIALDVGYDQLHPKIRNDGRVIVMEKYNFRYARGEDFAYCCDFFCSDVSFISLKLIIPSLVCCTKEHSEGVLLVKPQFEAGVAFVDKHGVVKKKEVHIRVIKDIIAFLEVNGFGVLQGAKSEVIGKSGNQEYLLHVVRGVPSKALDVEKLVLA